MKTTITISTGKKTTRVIWQRGRKKTVKTITGTEAVFVNALLDSAFRA